MRHLKYYSSYQSVGLILSSAKVPNNIYIYISCTLLDLYIYISVAIISPLHQVLFWPGLLLLLVLCALLESPVMAIFSLPLFTLAAPRPWKAQRRSWGSNVENGGFTVENEGSTRKNGETW